RGTTVTLTVDAQEAQSSSATESATSTYAWHRAGTYEAGSFAFSSYTDTTSVSESYTVTRSLTSTETMSFDGVISSSSHSTSAWAASGESAVHSYSSEATMQNEGTAAIAIVNQSQAMYTFTGSGSYTQSQQGSYAGGSFAFSDWTYRGTETSTLDSSQTATVSETLTSSGTRTFDSAYTVVSVVGGYWTYTGGTMMFTWVPPHTITAYDKIHDDSALSGTISVLETHTRRASETAVQSFSMQGSYSGGSFALSSTTYKITRSTDTSAADYSAETVTGTVHSYLSHTSGRSGGIVDNVYDNSTHSFTRQDTITSGSARTEGHIRNYNLYEGGTYGSQKWNLSSYNLSGEKGDLSGSSKAVDESPYKTGTLRPRRS